MAEQLKPLGGVLDDVIRRLAIVERQVGITPSAAGNLMEASSLSSSDDVHPCLVAYDEHVSRALQPFIDACTSLGPEMENIGRAINDVWSGMRQLVTLGTVYQRPSTGSIAEALRPHLVPCQQSMSIIQKARIDRKFDYHIKAMLEMLSCVSWVVMAPPPAPTSFIKDTIGASDFWSNKIRKEYKDKASDEGQHVKFCDTMKALILDLSVYVKEHHLSGLAWNPNGKDFAEAKVGEGSGGGNGAPKSTTMASASPSVASGNVGGAGGNVFAELMKKKTDDGTSAATGLKKVTKEQQTWRKEFKKDASAVPVVIQPVPLAPKFGGGATKKTMGPPKCEYQERGCKWIIENQTLETCEGGVCKVSVTDVKQQVYIYNCDNCTIQITGKLKSIILDSCTKLGVVFDTAISACEVVNCKRVQVQTTNVCPSFAIDKTDGIVVHLTGGEAISQTIFVTSKSSEMNVSWVDDNGEVKETPIPEQFQHRLVNGSVTSQVSDLYH
jgi:adenylyl cyclase-associated protein